jgi:hypothetical protein
MDYLWLYIGFFIIGALAIGVPLFISWIRKKRKPISIEKTLEATGPFAEDESHPQIVIKERDYRLYNQFIAEYGDEDLLFSNLQYRKGAPITCSFGVAEGFKYINGKMTWGFVRLHTGVDRAGGGSETFSWSDSPIRDIVKSPFDFNRSHFMYYGNKSYGTLSMLFNDKYGFEMRIAHMAPNDFVQWTLKQIKTGKHIGRNYVLGSAGTFGDSSGEHTHTEFLSLDESCEPFEILLEEKFGDKVHKEYTAAEVIREYRKYHQFKDASDSTILRDWEEMKKHRRAYFVNKYLYRYIDWRGNPRTRYSSELLFNGL